MTVPIRSNQRIYIEVNDDFRVVRVVKPATELWRDRWARWRASQDHCGLSFDNERMISQTDNRKQEKLEAKLIKSVRAGAEGLASLVRRQILSGRATLPPRSPSSIELYAVLVSVSSTAELVARSGCLRRQP